LLGQVLLRHLTKEKTTVTLCRLGAMICEGYIFFLTNSLPTKLRAVLKKTVKISISSLTVKNDKDN